MYGSSWAMTRAPCYGFGAKNAAKPAGGRLRQPHCPTWGRYRGAQPAMVRDQYGQVITDVQAHVRHPGLRWMGATLDGRVAGPPAPSSKPSSCCHGPSRRKPPPKNIRPSCSTICGRRGPNRSALDHYRRWQVGRNQDPRRSNLSAPDSHRGAEILALRRKWRTANSCSGLSRQSRGSKQCGSVDMNASNAWTEFAAICSPDHGQLTSNTNGRRPNSRA